MRGYRMFLAAVALGALLAAPAMADEGMWTIDNFPSAQVKAKYHVDINKGWLNRVRGAAVRLAGGCSASVVTSHGLVLTNHHCVRGCAQNLSTATTDYVKDGFTAAKRTDEKLCPGMQAEILDSISDVTGRVLAATAGKSGQGFVKARDAAIAGIEQSACSGREAKYRCQVISLYDGGQYKLYTYRKYSDVRLVFAPEAQTAYFGGDPDNFNFPRYDLDFSLVRLYENGKPVSTPHHLKWSTKPPTKGEPVFVAGNPGSTSRLLTVPQLKTLRNVVWPDYLYTLSELRGRLIRFSEESGEHARIANDMLFGVENGFKAIKGREQALFDAKLMNDKRKADTELRDKVMADPKLAQEIGDPWADIAKVQEAERNLYLRYTYMEGRAGYRSRLFGYARALVRAAEERTKPNADRLREYTDSRLPLLGKRVLDPEPVYHDLEQLTLEFWLTKLRENLTADAPGTKTFLGKDSPETLSARLAQSRLADPAYRKTLWEGGLWERATGQPPFNLMPRWQAAKGKVNDKTVFDFVTDNDIIGGNSGSPAITAKGDVIGAAFDGNIDSLGGDYYFDDSINRTVIVSTAAITEALKKIYHQKRLVKELTAR